MDLSKACNCFPHDLFQAKLLAYGFDDSAIVNYLSNSYQHLKTGSAFSSYL